MRWPERQADIVVALPGNNSSLRTSANHCHEVVLKSGRFYPPPLARGVRQMLNGLAELEFTRRRASPLQKLCGAGSEYGLKRLERSVSSELLSLLQPKAKHGIKNHLRRILVQATRPCLALELDAFRCAYEAIYCQKECSPVEVEKK